MFKKLIKKVLPSRKNKIPKVHKKTIFDISMRDLGRASKNFVKGVIIKTIRDW